MGTKYEKLSPENLLGWIHCNNCYEQYILKQRQMYILSCQHISCEKCIKSMHDFIEDDFKVCPICNKMVRYRLIGNALPPHMKQLFHPRLWEDGLPVAHILRFQTPHRNNLMNHVDQIFSKYLRLQEKKEEVRARARESFELLERMRHERQRLESKIRYIIQEYQNDLNKKKNALSRYPQTSLTKDSDLGTSI